MLNLKKCSISLGIVLSCATPLVSSAEPRIDSSKAAFHVGAEAMVCGYVAEVKNFSKGTYLNMGGGYPRQHISILVWKSDEDAFNSRFGSLEQFRGKHACARGLIESYRSALQLKVSNPQFLRLMQ